MKSKVIMGIMLTLLLIGMLTLAFNIQPVKAQHNMAGVYFDRSIYYPDTRVFWEPNLSVPIEIRVVDRDVNDNSVKVNVSSSIDSKELTLTKDVLGLFSGTVFAVGIGLMGEPISNTSSLNVRYGDEITAEYFDMSSGNNFATTALFLFPHYVRETVYNNPDSWESSSRYVFDSDGVPMVNYGLMIGLHYNPVAVSQYALANYQTYLNDGNTTRREKFLAQAKWLAENAKQKGNYSVWEYDFDWPSYGCTNPWVSAMAQGRGLSVLARAYVLTGNISYIDVAEEAILAFQVEMSAGGVRYTDPDGAWFEECADVGAPSSKVLNGFIAALLSLYEYSFETNNSKGWTFFWEGIETISNNIYRYDSGSWSYYDLLHYNHASLGYHKAHIDQLRTLYELTGNETFLYYSDKFQSYISPPPPPPPPQTPENTLTVYTLPSGVTFTVNNLSHMTPWSETYENGTLVSLVMPEYPTVGDSRYHWDQWSDGNASQSRTFTMDTNITLAAYFTGPLGPLMNLDTEQSYRTIQEAINNASEGDRILAFSGTYFERVVVNKSVSLIGENRDTTIIDGNEMTTPIVQITANNVTIRGFTIQNSMRMLGFEGGGIYITNSNRNNIVDNTITNTQYGINLRNSTNNTITGNNIIENDVGIQFLDGYSGNSIIYHNNFINNGWQVSDFAAPNNTWDNGYPSGGNCWSGHNPPDIYSGPFQNETGRDKIGDTPYIIDENNTDRYPLIHPYGYVPSPDVNDDGIVDIYDIVICTSAYGSRPGDSTWNPIADIRQDGIIDLFDIVIIGINYGKTY